jgi:hypothetical protein
MTYSVHQPWDPLRVCVVGRSYPPQFYDYITNRRVRQVMYRIAEETEEDFQSLIKLLQQFGVTVLRPIIEDDRQAYFFNGRFEPPPMTPCDWSVMIGDRFFHNWRSATQVYVDIADPSWPPPHMPWSDSISQEVAAASGTVHLNVREHQHILDHLLQQGNTIIERPHRDCGNFFHRAQVTRIGRDLYFGTAPHYNQQVQQDIIKQHFHGYRCHVIDTQGHSDATFCPVIPGLIISLHDIPTYKNTFPDWEVVYLEHEHPLDRIPEWIYLKERNQGRWWVAGEELNEDFTNFVESWMSHWVGMVHETVFDINMFMIDRHNAVVSGYNRKVFDAFDRHGITAHVIELRHRWFWDGGLHCITSDLHRDGACQDFFPQRG